MKHVLLFCGSAEDAAAFEAPGELRAGMSVQRG